jgi:hypothetical protein
VTSGLRANPAMGYRIREEFVAKERAAMSDVTFARERLGIVDESRNATVIDLEAWAAAGTRCRRRSIRCAFAIDIGPDAAFTSIAVAGATADGRVHTEVVDRAPRYGLGGGFRIEELRDKWSPSSIVIDPIGPVGLAAAVVRGRWCRDHEVGDAGARAGVWPVQGPRRGREARAQGPAGLTAALESARKRDAGEAGAWLWNRRDETDISRWSRSRWPCTRSRRKPPRSKTTG